MIEASDRVRLAALSRGGWIPSPELTKNVAQTLADVRARGDEALIDHTSRLRVPIPMHEGAKTLVPPEVADALRLVKERVTRFYERQQRADLNYADEDGTRYGLRFCPLESVAAYVPGGPSARPSSVIMNIMPAKIARVNRTVVLSPPQADGNVHPAVLFACSLCEVDELYA
ncbi:MAG TPA: histidinol dehydrogenase, partial [Candidatus Baltobacteraceae bacterium]|nr:histidinol dehydrogenase [Candidatus Baltobacteraceae bacterium]